MIQRKKLKGPQGKMRKKKTRSDSGGLSGKMMRETRSGTGFKMTASRWLAWAWAVRSRSPWSRARKSVSILLVTQRDEKPPVMEGLLWTEYYATLDVLS